MTTATPSPDALAQTQELLDYIDQRRNSIPQSVVMMTPYAMAEQTARGEKHAYAALKTYACEAAQRLTPDQHTQCLEAARGLTEEES